MTGGGKHRGAQPSLAVSHLRWRPLAGMPKQMFEQKHRKTKNIFVTSFTIIKKSEIIIDVQKNVSLDNTLSYCALYPRDDPHVFSYHLGEI